MFGDKVKEYIQKLTSKKKPKKVLVCMIYYPDLKRTGSWADNTLDLLGYDENSDPSKLQGIISRLYDLGTSSIKLEGT